MFWTFGCRVCGVEFPFPPPSSLYRRSFSLLDIGKDVNTKSRTKIRPQNQLSMAGGGGAGGAERFFQWELECDVVFGSESKNEIEAKNSKFQEGLYYAMRRKIQF